MDEQQMLQILDQIPLDVLQNYITQRAKNEQSRVSTTAQTIQSPQNGSTNSYAYGGPLDDWSPYVDVYYARGGRRKATIRGRMGAQKHRY